MAEDSFDLKPQLGKGQVILWQLEVGIIAEPADAASLRDDSPMTLADALSDDLSSRIG
jgi:hypothetical protein